MHDENKPNKIAFLTVWNPYDKKSWSGITYYMAQALQKHCGELSYWYNTPTFPSKKVDLIGRSIRVSSRIVLKKTYTFSFFQAKAFARAGGRWLTEQSFDVIVAPDGAREVAFLETNIPIVLVGDSTFGSLFDYYPKYSHLMKRSAYEIQTIQALALRKASAVIYSSTWAARSAIEDYATDPRKVHIIPFGANLDMSPSREVALQRKQSGRCQLLFLAVEWVRKGGEIAFETLLKLEEMGIAAELIVCGCVPPKMFVHNHMRVIPFLNKNDKQQHKALEQLLLQSHFLLVPTRADCTPIIFCEAGAFGLPVITTDTGGVSEIVRDGETGFLLPYNARGDAYAEVIARTYRDDVHYTQLMSAGRLAFENRLNWDAWGVACKKILTELLGPENIRRDSQIVTNSVKDR